ncbi:hypothetical protein RV04_GL001344 [Enterococcus hermanniensis]|uniref:Uncharacterized protein n=2 Tax=Enterococcus hermanniensis TaxID=249189 RepID=A0A1L8TPS8_9ENTE|nr:hypothetical protein RV04_GL001344 [Enterococcus hermanniensis]
MSGIIFVIVYGLTMLMIDFGKLPGYFTYYMALFSLIGFSQSLSAIFNVFFESKDLVDYLPLPIKQSYVFMAKFLAVGLTIVPFLLPLLVLFFLTAFKSGVPIPLALFLAIVLFLIFFFLLFSLCSLIVFGLTRTKSFRRHKKLFTSLMLGFSMLISVGGILAINFTQNSSTYESVQQDRHPISLFLPFYQVMHQLVSVEGLLMLLGIFLVTVILLVLLKGFVIPSLYEQFSDEGARDFAITRKYKSNQSLTKQLTNYNFQLIKNPSLIMQVLTSSLIMPIVMVATIMSTKVIDLQALSNRYFGVLFLTGIVFASVMMNQTSFVSNLISLDRENFSFIQSLPLSMHRYLKQKFWIGCMLQMGISGIIGLAIAVIIHLPIILIMSFSIGVLFGTYLLALYFFARDYRLLNVTWTNVNQLFTRGGGNFGLVVWLMAVIFVGVILISLYAFAISLDLNAFILNGSVLLWLLIMSGAWVWINHNNFWKRFNY